METLVWKRFALQILLRGMLVFINLLVHQGLYQDHSKQKTQESTRIAEVQEVISEALAV